MSDLGDRPLTQSLEDAEVCKVVLCETLRLRDFAAAFGNCGILTPHLAEATRQVRLKPAD